MNFFILSKGSIICILLSIILIGTKEKQHRYKIIILAFLITIIGYERVLSLFQNDIKYFTSIITRSWSIITAVICFILFPIGSGGSYLVFYSFIGEKVKEILQMRYSFFSFTEIEFMLDSGVALSPKSGFFFGVLIAGIGYLKFSYNNFKYFFLKLKNESILLTLLIFFFTSNIFYSSEFQAPHQILIYSIFTKIINERRKLYDNTF